MAGLAARWAAAAIDVRLPAETTLCGRESTVFGRRGVRSPSPSPALPCNRTMAAWRGARRSLCLLRSAPASAAEEEEEEQQQQAQEAQEAQEASALRGKLLHCNKGFVQIAMSSSFALEAL